jgi:hypothetical protein
MSRQSKAKRDARKKKLTREQVARRPASLPVHARLTADDAVVAGVVLEDADWVLFLDGRAVTSTESAAMMLAMLRHTATAWEQKGRVVRLDYSIHMRDTATAEAESEGKTLDEYLQQLEVERLERRMESAERQSGATSHH